MAITLICDECHETSGDLTFDDLRLMTHNSWGDSDWIIDPNLDRVLCDQCNERADDDGDVADYPEPEPPMAGHPNPARALPMFASRLDHVGGVGLPRFTPTIVQYGERCPACGLLHFWRAV